MLHDELSVPPNRDDYALQIELQASEDRYRDLFEQASDSIFIVDLATYQILDANPSAARRLGYTRQELLALTMADVEIAITSPRIWLSSGSDSIVTEGRHQRKDGSQMPVEVSSRVVTSGGKQVLQLFVRDITQRQQAEERDKLLAIEQQRVQLLGNFVRTVAQEFRTPLTLVNTSMYFLERITDKDQQVFHQEKLKAQIQYISHLVETMLAMARLESVTEFDQRPVDLNPVLQAVLTNRQEEIKQKELSLVLDLPSDLSAVNGESEELRQAFDHLIANAIDYTPSGGTITLRIWEEHPTIIVEIGDTGIGINQEELSRIFDPFYRIDEAMTERKVGLGLAIAQKIIELHHGQIEVESVPDQGTTFRVFLPTNLAT